MTKHFPPCSRTGTREALPFLFILELEQSGRPTTRIQLPRAFGTVSYAPACGPCTAHSDSATRFSVTESVSSDLEEHKNASSTRIIENTALAAVFSFLVGSYKVNENSELTIIDLLCVE